MAIDEIKDVGKGVDKPKGFVKQSIWGLAFALTSMCAFCVRLLILIDKNNTQCSISVQTVIKEAAAREAKMKDDYYNELKERLNRLENVEEKADKVLLKQKNTKK